MIHPHKFRIKKKKKVHYTQQISTCMITFHVLEYFIIVKMEFKMNEKQHFFFLSSSSSSVPPCTSQLLFLSFSFSFFLRVWATHSHISYLWFLRWSSALCFQHYHHHHHEMNASNWISGYTYLIMTCTCVYAVLQNIYASTTFEYRTEEVTNTKNVNV